MKKRLLCLALILGGVMVFFSLNGYTQKQQEEMQQRQLETSIAKLLVNEYDSVEEIEFRKWSYFHKTGTWRVTAIVNKESIIHYSFSEITDLGKLTGIRYNPCTFKLVTKNGAENLAPIKHRLEEIELVKIDNLKITYFNKKAGE